jgi:heterotetrameric sarcosine oxidase delta subunit
MRQVPCPHCGPREPAEFVCLGEPPARADAAEVYLRLNAKGPVDEFWWHRAGCRRWLRLRRDTATNRFSP